MQERRKTPRRRSYLGGQIGFHQRSAAMDCLVRNYSVSGAKLVFHTPVLIPEEFDLTVPHKQRCFRVRTAWRRSHEMGVFFVEEQRSQAVPLDASRRLRELQDQCAALKRRVAELSAPE